VNDKFERILKEVVVA